MAKGKLNPMKTEDDWRVEDDLRTVCGAKEIMADEKRYAKVKELAKKKMTEIAAIVGEK